MCLFMDLIQLVTAGFFCGLARKYQIRCSSILRVIPLRYFLLHFAIYRINKFCRLIEAK